VRFLAQSRQVLAGRAWSGRAPVTKVEVSSDGGRSWANAALGDQISPYAWREWTCKWDATRTGDYELMVRATDGAGNVQPTEQNWNREGVQNNAVQRIRVAVTKPNDHVQRPADQPS